MNWGCLPPSNHRARRKTLPGGSTPASMRVTVLGRYPQLMSLVVNGTAVLLFKILSYDSCLSGSILTLLSATIELR